MRFQGRGRGGKRVEGLIKEKGFTFFRWETLGNAPDTPPDTPRVRHLHPGDTVMTDFGQSVFGQN